MWRCSRGGSVCGTELGQSQVFCFLDAWLGEGGAPHTAHLWKAKHCLCWLLGQEVAALPHSTLVKRSMKSSKANRSPRNSRAIAAASSLAVGIFSSLGPRTKFHSPYTWRTHAEDRPLFPEKAHPWQGCPAPRGMATPVPL